MEAFRQPDRNGEVLFRKWQAESDSLGARAKKHRFWSVFFLCDLPKCQENLVKKEQGTPSNKMRGLQSPHEGEDKPINK